MPGAARATVDTISGSPITSGSPDVNIDNLPAARLNDPVAAYFPYTGEIISEASPTVFVNGIPLARLDDLDNNGNPIETASDDVYADGGAAPPPNIQPIALSSAFSVDVPVPQIPAANISAAAVTQSQSPGVPQTAYIPAVLAQNIESNYNGTSTDAVAPNDAPTGEITPPVSSDLIAWLTARLEEAKQGQWTRMSPPAGQGPPVSPGNPNIIGIWKALGLSAFTSNDQTAWCMGFVNFALKQNGYRWCPEASAVAIQSNPSRWGASSIALDAGQPGDICYWGFHHVNFIYTASGGKYTFVGGNQGGKSIGNNNPKSSVVSQSWGSGYLPPGDGTLLGIFRPVKV